MIKQEIQSKVRETFTQEIIRIQQRYSVNNFLVNEYGFINNRVNCVNPHDYGQTFDLQIQLCVLKPKKLDIQKQKMEQTKEGISTINQINVINSKLNDQSQLNSEQRGRQNDSQIQKQKQEQSYFLQENCLSKQETLID